MKKTQSYIAAIPIALFIAIESVAILLFGPSTTFWIESAFSLAMLGLVVSALLFGPQTNLKIFGISKILVVGVSFTVQLPLSIRRVRAKDRGASSNSNSQLSASKRCDNHTLRNGRFRIPRVYY